MKTLKNLLIALVLIVTTGLIVYQYTEDGYLLGVITILIPTFFAFNLIVRRSLSFKPYFTSKYNVFTAKFKAEKSFDIPKELLFEKMIEVISQSKFKLVDTDKERCEILAITSISFESWGENIYISFESIENETLLKFNTTTLFSMYSWGKMEKNFNVLMNEVEGSLIV